MLPPLRAHNVSMMNFSKLVGYNPSASELHLRPSTMVSEADSRRVLIASELRPMEEILFGVRTSTYVCGIFLMGKHF